MEINRNNIKEITEKTGIKPDKDYGQNFLLEPSVCERIVNALEIQEDDAVLEIGPGLGSLTHFLSLSKAKTTVVDIDKRMTDYLSVVYKNSNINILLNDIRKTDVTSYTKILGNLPYNITTETVIYLLMNARSAKKMILMCQLEAFDRFFDKEGENYGPASILVSLLGDSKKLFTVKPGSFYPAPKCVSVVFEISLCSKLEFEKVIKIYKFAKQLFLNRRKTIYNNLSLYLNDKEKAKKCLDLTNIEPNKRPEEIPYLKFVEMYSCLNNL